MYYFNRRTTDSIDSRRQRADSSPKSQNRPRDVKRRRELRKIKEEGRRKSMPPELDRYHVVQSSKKKSVEAGNATKEEFLFVSPIRNFNERPVDCEGLNASSSKGTYLGFTFSSQPYILLLAAAARRMLVVFRFAVFTGVF